VKHARGRRELIAVGGKPAGIWCWDRGTGRLLWQAALAEAAGDAVLSSDGKTLVTSESSGVVRVWDVPAGKQRSCFRPVAIGHEDAVAVSPDGKTVATTSGRDLLGAWHAARMFWGGETVVLTPGFFSTPLAFWDAATGKPLPPLPGHAAGITATAFSPDGSTIYTIGMDRTLRTWDPASGRQLSAVPTESAASLAVAPDGKTLFAAGADTGVMDVLYGRVEYRGHTWPYELADAGVIRVLDARTGKQRRKLRAFRGPLHGMALTADGRRLFTAGRDGQTDVSLVRVFDARSGAKLQEFESSAVLLEQLVVRPDGKAMATTDVKRRVRLSDGSGKTVQEHVGRSGRWSGKALSSRIC
jgi:WD40 repeat protein